MNFYADKARLLLTVVFLQVVFGVPFGLEVDMWSLGCVLAELFLGKPLFFASCTENLLEKVSESYNSLVYII